jgi:hypothetical protein
MSKSNCHPHELQAAAKEGKLELNAIHVDFCNSGHASREKQEKFHQDILKIQEKVHSTTFAREDFKAPTQALGQMSFLQFLGTPGRTAFGVLGNYDLKGLQKEIAKSAPPPKNPYQEEMISDVKEVIASVRWMGAGLELVGETIVGLAKAICKAPLPNDFGGLESPGFRPESTSPPLTGEKFCRSVLHVATTTGKEVLNAANLKEPVKQAVNYWKSLDGSTVKTSLIALGIPEQEAAELGKQYVSDLKTISLSALPASTLKVPISVIRTFNRAAVTIGEQLAFTSELFYLNNLNKSTFPLLHPIPSVPFHKSATLHKFIKDEAGTFRFTRQPKILLTEAEELAARRLEIQNDRGFEIAALKRINVERVKALNERETAIRVAEVLNKENNQLGLIGLGSRVAQKQKAHKASKLDKLLLQNIQPIVLPKIFPKNMTEFYKNSTTLENITYKKIGEDIIFFLRSTRNSKTASIENSVLKASAIAERKNAKRIFLTWDPETHSVGSFADKSKSIVGVGEMARGEFDPFVLVEISTKAS